TTTTCASRSCAAPHSSLRSRPLPPSGYSPRLCPGEKSRAVWLSDALEHLFEIGPVDDPVVDDPDLSGSIDHERRRKTGGDVGVREGGVAEGERVAGPDL